MSTTVHKYRLKCTTEGLDKYVWREDSEAEPTTCPTDTNHTVNGLLTTIVQTVEENEVKVHEHDATIGGYYKTKGEFLNIPASHVVAGSLTAPYTSGDSELSVDQATIDALVLDHHIQLKNGTSSGLIGQVIAIDNTNNKINVNYVGDTPENFSTSGTNIEIVTTTKDFIQPINIGVLSYAYQSTSDHTGDGLEVQVYPELVIGALTSSLSTGGTVLDVQQSVIDNIKVGFYCRIDDGNVNECMGLVLNVDDDNNQITVQKPALHNFSAASPTYVKITIKMLEMVDIGAPGPYSFGEDKLGSSTIVANKAVRVCYNNYTGGQKKFCFNVGHLY